MTTTRYGEEPFEIACDESGWAGENLLDAGTDVFAHASVRLSPHRAEHIVAEVRERIGSPAEEYKATHLLRARHRDVLEWFLDADGPLRTDAHVYLVDKPFAVVRALADVLIGSGYAAGEVDELAVDLQRTGTTSLGAEGWGRFLIEANAALRAKRRIGPPEQFAVPRGDEDVAAAAVAFVTRVAAAPWNGTESTRPPAQLDPLLPAMVRTARYWTSGGSVITLVHHRQSTLTEDRRAELVAEPTLEGRVSQVRMADSRTDLRVQIADFVAGVARSIASAERGGHGDAVLTELLRPYVDVASMWGDQPSWLRLRP